MELLSVPTREAEPINFILGQAHFINDLHAALVGEVPGTRFGLAFCEASGKWLVHWSGTDFAMIEVAKATRRRSARHRFWRSLLPAPAISRSPLR